MASLHASLMTACGLSHPQLRAQAHWTVATVCAALLVRKVARLECTNPAAAAGAGVGAGDAWVCAARGALGGRLGLAPSVGLLLLGGLAVLALLGYLLWRVVRKAPVYILDFAVYNPDPR
jgi:hypothetical protein